MTRQVEVKISSTDRNDTQGVGVFLESKGPAGGLKRDEARSVTVNEGSPTTFTMRPGQRLVIEAKETDDDLVYDREQGAAVRRSNQRNDSGRADRPGPQAEGDEKTRLEQADQRRQAEAKALGLDQRQERGAYAAPESSPEAARPKSGPQLQTGGQTVGQATANQERQSEQAKPSFINKQGKEKTYVAALDALNEGLVEGPSIELGIPNVWDAVFERSSA